MVERTSPVSETLTAEINRWEDDNRTLYPDAEVLASLERIRQAIGHAQTPANTLEVRQHIAWLFQYVQGMNERNWHDMKLRAEWQLEQLSLAFPGPSGTSTDRPDPTAQARATGTFWVEGSE